MAWTAPHTFVAGEELTAATLNAQIRDNFNAAFPVGSIHFFMQAATTAETTINGFAIEINGVNVSRTTYANLNTLFAGLGYPFGTGDGSTTMGLPDASGRTLVAMAASGHSDVNALGKTDGLTKASRSPFHATSRGTLTATAGTLAVGAGTLGVSITDNGHAHTQKVGASSGGSTEVPTGVNNSSTPPGTSAGNTATATTGITAAITGTPALTGTPSLSGTAGLTGTRPSDTVPFVVPGVYGVKY